MIGEHYVVMTVECYLCKTKQKVHVASREVSEKGFETITCISCKRAFDVRLPDKVVAGSFPV
jgi:hypothetical protein